jgi:protein ImuB
LEVCRRLLERMLAPLQGKRRGVRRLLCQLHGCGGRPCELSVGMVSPSNSATQMRELLELQLERVAWEEEITLVRLEATEVAPLEEQPRDLFGDQFGEDHSRELRWLLERLSNRLGSDAVVRATYVPDPQPELAVAYQPWVASAMEKPAGKADLEETGEEQSFGSARPLRLFAPQRIEVPEIDSLGAPSRFFWGHVDHHVRQAWGPERIETGWWRGNPVRRDYYRVEVTSGERYWLFHADDGWFVHGTFE